MSLTPRRAFVVVLALLTTFAAFGTTFACSGEKQPSGLGEPVRVRNGVFKDGPLPGDPPGGNAAPTITAIETSSTVLRPGQGEKTLTGRASPGAVAVAIALDGLGSGYWLLPVDGPDPLNANELGWSALVEIARDVPGGRHELRLVAIDAEGHAGVQRGLEVCVPGVVPDNLNACNPDNKPPASVVSLSWDTSVDLDLVIVGPDGRVIDAKHPRVVAEPPADAGAASLAAIDRDSNGACVIDDIRRENLVFPDAPAPGSYLVFANLFDACGQASVRFHVEVYERAQASDGKSLTLALAFTKDGFLTRDAINGGAALGTYVTEVAF